jgi:hypothetical protein
MTKGGISTGTQNILAHIIKSFSLGDVELFNFLSGGYEYKYEKPIRRRILFPSYH